MTDTNTLNAITPSNYQLFSSPRLHKTGGGLIVLFKDNVHPIFKVESKENMAEMIRIEFTIGSDKFVILCVYRLHVPYNPFVDFLRDYLSDIQLETTSNCFVIGDINIKVNLKDDPAAKTYLKMLHEIDFIQLVDFHTHISLNTLDHIVTNVPLIIHEIYPTAHIASDHSVVICEIKIPKKEPEKQSKLEQVRNWKNLNHDLFLSYLEEQFFRSCFTATYDVDRLIHIYEDITLTALDKFLPKYKKNIKSKAVPFFDNEMYLMRRKRRQLERKSLKTKHASDWNTYKSYCEKYHELIITKKKEYYKRKLESTDSKNMFRTCKNLLSINSEKSKLPTSDKEDVLADNFNSYFIEKILDIRKQIPVSPQHDYTELTTNTSFDRFKLVTDIEVRKVISSLSTKHSLLDTLPTWFIKQHSQFFIPIFTHLVNASFSSQTFPQKLKESIVFPKLKKPNSDKENFKNYRPVSNVPFLSKIMEKIVDQQLEEYFQENNLHEIYQSGYKKLHSVETVLLKITNDIYLSKENKKYTALCLIDLSAAFDTIDHTILLEILRKKLKLKEPVLNWLKSFLTNRQQSVIINNSKSSKKQLLFGVPQGTILGPKIFSLYMLPLYEIFKNKNIRFHSYADDTQFYLETTSNDLESTKEEIIDILAELKHWLDVHKLKMNREKTEIILFGSASPLTVKIDDELLTSCNTVRNLGVLLDKNLTLEDQISKKCRDAFLELKDISRNRKFMDFETCKMIVSSLVLSKLNFCCVLYIGLPKYQIEKLQKVQNYAAKVITMARKFDRVTPLLKRLNWLTVENYMLLRYSTLIYKSLNNTAPMYLQNEIKNYVPQRDLRSGYRYLLNVPRIDSELGRRSFTYLAPTIWNDIPFEIRMSSETMFKRKIREKLQNSQNCRRDL